VWYAYEFQHDEQPNSHRDRTQAFDRPPEAECSDGSRKTLLAPGADGKPVESVEEMFDRVARTVADTETRYSDAAPDRSADTVRFYREAFYDLITSLRFFPNSPTFTGASTPLGQLAACFVLPIADDMGRDPQGIFSTLRAAALVQQTGGGNCFSFSRLRPRGDSVAASSGKASGPVGFLKVFDTAFGEVAQGGTRRGANMGVLRVDHPDILDFIRSKGKEGATSN
jgi:ribonucleoside-diphosphate reductase alpha chain